MVPDKTESHHKLTPRQREILRILVQDYIASATPVGSNTIQQIGGLEVSSATIRNELAALEELGYVAQPHTSAGRVPTVGGYRYFVEQLMERVELPAREQRTIRHQFHQIRLDLDQWMRLTAAVLAHTVQSASLVTPPRAISSRLRHLDLILIHDTLLLMILVLEDGSTHQEMLATSIPIDQDRLGRMSGKLNRLLRGRSAREIRNSTDPELTDLEGEEGLLLGRILALMHHRDQRSFSQIYRDGLGNVLRQPEFVEAGRFQQVVEMMEHQSWLESILAGILNTSGVQIIIGGEGAYQEINEVSLVLSPYGVRGKATGILGIMGPTRLPYARAISTVRYVAHLMDGLIADVCGMC